MRNVVLHLPRWLTDANTEDPSTPAASSKLRIIYFITGNPGLISYYESFLKLLAEGSGRDSIVAGASLGGFEIPTQTTTESKLEHELLYPHSFTHKPLYNLRDQITLTYLRLNSLIANLSDAYPATRDLPVQVVLTGHSVGAYIALEVVRLHHKSYTSTHQDFAPFTIPTAIHLTPTILNIAHSPSGRLATPLLSYTPFLPNLLQLASSIISSTMPVSWLGRLVSTITGMQAGSEGLESTVAFLRTVGAVRQSLELAGWEMKEIGEEQWMEEVWGATEGEEVNGIDGVHAGETVKQIGSETMATGKGGDAPWTAPKHYFLFAKEDHWVADATRDAIVKAMGGRAEIVIDEPEQGAKGLVHAWCLEQNEMVANIVNGWLAEALQ